MITHVVLFRPRTGVSAGDRRALALAFEHALRGIPSVRRAQVGRRVLRGAGYEATSQPDYPYAAIIEFDDVDGLEVYLRHETHVEVAERFFAAIETGLIFDYEMTDGVGVAASLANWLD